MRVGINCLQIDPSYAGGVNTYTLGVLKGFASIGQGCRFQLYVSEANQHLFEEYRRHDQFEVVVIPSLPLKLKRVLCEATVLFPSRKLFKITSDVAFKNVSESMDANSDVVYTPTPKLQWFNSRRPTVLSMHDIQHLHFPEFFSWARRRSRKITYGLSAQYARYFQASSQFIKEDLVKHFAEITPEQIEVIPEGVTIEEFATPQGSISLPAHYDLPERFLFYPAQLWPHKNHLTVLQALKQIERSYGLKIPLVLTGAKYSAAPKIFSFVADQSMAYVRYLGKVPFQELVALYHKAAFLITAVLYESSSLAILEAAAAGTPIIASRTPPNEEAAQVLQLNLFNPLSADELARLLVSLWNDHKTATEQVAYNRRQITNYSWENVARKYMRLFERIVEE